MTQEKKIEYETCSERARRERTEKIVQDYLSRAGDIENGISPNRVIMTIASQYGISGAGVKTILRREGIYISSQQPVVFPSTDNN